MGGAPPRGAEPPARWGAVARVEKVRQRELKPTDARYDPVALSQEAADELTALEIFEGEPRSPELAPLLEGRTRSSLDGVLRELGLVERTRGITIECRTLSCRTQIEVSKADGPQLYDQLNGILLGDVQSPSLDTSDPAVSRVVLVDLFRRETTDEAYYRRFVEEAMRPALDYIKQRYAGSGDAARR